MGEVARILRVGGHPAVDFANTLGGSPSNADDEYLHDYTDLLDWALGGGLLDRQVTEALRSAAAREAAHADEVFHAALDLRANLDAVLRAHLSDRSVTAADREALRDAYAAAVARADLVPREDLYAWSWSGADLERPLWPVAHHAVDLLREGPLSRLARCEHCRWLYLDTSKNRSRRWCSMAACGAVVKMRRYRANRRSPDAS